MRTERFDVLVIGGGLAGICAALEASQHDARVALCCDGAIAAGASFAPSTWGLGMIGPLSQSQADKNNLSESILRAGLGMAGQLHVERLVSEASEGFEFLTRHGAILDVPSDPNQREFIPCFDDGVRSWRGLKTHESAEPLRSSLDAAGVEVFEHHEAVSLLLDGESVRGALTLHNLSTPVCFLCSSVILAGGGACGIHNRCLEPKSLLGSSWQLAIDAGATCVNLEFQQVMVGLLSPIANVVLNEKLYRKLHIFDADLNSDLSTWLPGTTRPFATSSWDDALESHALHGPFTCERPSSSIELCIQHHEDQTGRLASVSYAPEVSSTDQPEFVRTYFAWLTSTYGIGPRDDVRVGLFAHASNGGVAIDVDGRTSVDGLYAAGEAAGGLHGADRIGGLASVSCVVFGRAAGRAAAQHAADDTNEPSTRTLTVCSPLSKEPVDVSRHLDTLRQACDRHLLLGRDDEGLRSVLRQTGRIHRALGATTLDLDDESFASEADTRVMGNNARLRAACVSATAMTLSALARTESRGSHFRLDHPAHDESLGQPMPLDAARVASALL